MTQDPRKEALFDGPEAQQLVGALKGARTLLLTTHEGPDADGMGSELALARALRRLGKRVFIRNADPPARRFQFLNDAGDLVVFRNEDIPLVQEVDLVLLVDTAELRRAGRVGEAIRRRQGATLALDHHAAGSETLPGLLGPDFSSTGEMVAGLMPTLGLPLTPDLATPLYAAILFDTAQFRFCRNDPGTFRVAAALVEAGADAEAIGKRLFGSARRDARVLEARILNDAHFECDGRLAWAAVEPRHLQGLQVDRDEIRSLVNLIGDIEGVEVACLFKSGESTLKVSLRSRGRHPVLPVAEALGGGGHPFAAGADVPWDLATAIDRTLPSLRTMLEDAGEAPTPRP
ncbi:MAG TPA: DHH family phosphoesterase [Myxococcota bacterium]|nr:DHH family phosphoesterase [Myxococcota bacterium]HQK52076.1 DHH family phosphoesterase [Myxococcota bacterium]